MYFRSNDPRKTSLDNFLKSLVSSFRRTFDKHHGKGPQTLLKSDWQHLYHFFWIIMKAIGSENVSISYMQNFKTVS